MDAKMPVSICDSVITWLYTTEDEMAGWHHRLNGHELGQIPGGGEGQESLACCSP